MKKKALDQAKKFFGMAERAIQETNSFAQFPQQWSNFLQACSAVYIKIEQGAKGCQISEPWFGRKKHQRKTDPLLQYLHHARDADYHGIETVFDIVKGNVNIYSSDDFISVKIDKNLKGESTLTNNSPLPIRVDINYPYYKLVRVKDERFGDWFDPPTTHLGQPIEIWPLPVSMHMLAYLKKMIEEAEKLPARL